MRSEMTVVGEMLAARQVAEAAKARDLFWLRRDVKVSGRHHAEHECSGRDGRRAHRGHRDEGHLRHRWRHGRPRRQRRRDE
eukprot:672973-Pleurochrysis_carterae.AAC.1